MLLERDQLANALIARVPPHDGSLPQQVADTLVIELQQLAAPSLWQASPLLPASAGEELLYLIASSAHAALYLVSDGVGTSSPPHEHQTWAMIAGIRGIERNDFYQRDALTGIRLQSQRNVGVGEVVALTREAVHATSVQGAEPTYHLHLYGARLQDLPPFAQRCVWPNVGACAGRFL